MEVRFKSNGKMPKREMLIGGTEPPPHVWEHPQPRPSNRRNRGLTNFRLGLSERLEEISLYVEEYLVDQEFLQEENTSIRRANSTLQRKLDEAREELRSVEATIKAKREELGILTYIEEKRVEQANADHRFAIQMQESIDEEASRKLAEQLQGES